MLLASRVIIFVYEVLCIFWYYINVDEVSLITLKTLLQGAMELLQIATAQFITKCDGLLLQIATAFLLLMRQVLQSAMIITNCDSTVVLCFDRLKNRSKFEVDEIQ